MNSVSKISDASAVSSLARKRPGKRLRAPDTSVSNIHAYRHDGEPSVKVEPPAREIPKRTLGRAANDRKPARNYLGSVGRSHVALAVAGCFCVSATIAAASWPKSSETEEAVTLETLQDEVNVATTPQPEAISTSSAVESAPGVALEPQSAPVTTQLSAEDEKLTVAYLAEIRQLKVVNTELKHEVKSLSQETLELNEELLALELEEAARIRVIYNFVNDPSQAPADEYFDNNQYYNESGDQQDAWVVDNGDDQLQAGVSGGYVDEQPYDPTQDPDYQFDTEYVFNYDEDERVEEFRQQQEYLEDQDLLEQELYIQE